MTKEEKKDLGNIPKMLRRLADRIERFEVSYKAIIAVAVPYNGKELAVFGWGNEKEVTPVGVAEGILARGIKELEHMEDCCDK